MWRRNERLGYWLKEPRKDQKRGEAPGFGQRLVRRFSLGDLSAAVSDCPLRIEAVAEAIDPGMDALLPVRDGLAIFGDGPDYPFEFACRTKEESLIKDASVRSLGLPEGQKVRIRNVDAIRPATARSANPVLRAPVVKEGALVPPATVVAQESVISAAIGHKIMISQIIDLPHFRKSADIKRMAEAEYQSFIREAEILKSIPAERGELLAVFRHVPIEMISQLRFVADRNAIEYSVSMNSQRTQTRVHDMAAVRNVVSGEIHLFAHRTSYRTAFIN
jgi:hypothetical protein